jgi:3-hydroxyisobutyrate dehydrogenase
MTRATPLGLAAKDARLILEASDGKLELAVAQQVERRFREGVEAGNGGLDMAAVYRAVRESS